MAIDVSLNTVKEKIGAGLRVNKFSAEFPALGDGQEGDITYFLQSASTPTKNIGEIPINWQGLQYKVPGDVTYDAFTVGFICDKNNSSYKYMSLWMDLVIDVQTNSRGLISDIKKNLELHQLGNSNEIISTWECVGLFPTNVSEISYDRDSADTIGTFTATFAMDSHNFKSI